LPELADRIIVISHGSLFGDGEIHKVLQDAKLLESSGLEPPTMVKLFTELKSLGLISQVPITTTEGKEELVKLLKDRAEKST
jgi:hypothetical protein